MAGVTHKSSFSENLFFNWYGDLLEPTDKIGILSFKEIFIPSTHLPFTNEKGIDEVIEIINSCDCIIGNESGPVCLGASLKKEVHSIYLPLHTPPESKIISNTTFYYNTDKEDDETIINKILQTVLS